MSTQISIGNSGFLSLLTILFIALKLTHVIDWNWFWVLSPTLIPLILYIGFFVISLSILAIGALGAAIVVMVNKK